MDVVDSATRSRMMAGIRGKDTKPELVVRRYLHRTGLRYRLHAKLPGKPDLVFPKYKVALFVHGCFWHRHEGCVLAAVPASNATFWKRKFIENVQRDERAQDQLRDLGWRVEIVWACQASPRELTTLAKRIKRHAHRGCGHGET